MSQETLEVVFRRDLTNDLEYIQDRVGKTGCGFSQAIIAQLAAEINANERFNNKFTFSQVVLVEGDEYYVKGRIIWGYRVSLAYSVACLCETMQTLLYNDPQVAVAGHFRVVSIQQPDDDLWPVPPWHQD